MINNLVSIFSAVFLLYVTVSEYRYGRARRLNKRMLKSFDGYILEVRHFYYQSGLIGYAVREAAERAGDVLRPYAGQLADMLDNPDSADPRDAFRGVPIQKHLKLFLLLALNVDEYGDVSVDTGSSGFLQNLLYIRMDLKTELRLLEKCEHLFMGFALTATLPAVTMRLIASWACSAIPQLTGFYYGRRGAFLLVIIMLLTCFSYSSVTQLREGRNKRRHNSRLYERHIEKTFIGKIIEKIIVRNYTRALRHKELLRRLGEPYSVPALYLRQGFSLAVCIAILLVIYLDESVQAGMGAPDWFIIPMAAAASFFAPYLLLRLKSSMSGDRIQEEIVDLHTAVSMMAGTDGISSIGMLEVMESFADIFRPAIRRCIDSFTIDEEAALDSLKQEEGCEQFARIADCFYMVDDIGVDGAFGEISDDRKNFREYRNQENEFMLEDRSRLAMLLAILPGLAILFIYLLIPFMTEALNMFESYASNIEGAL